MAKYKNNTGALWLNKYKGAHDKRPNFVGEITVEGVVYQIAGWDQPGANPKSPVMTLKVSKPYVAASAVANPPVQEPVHFDDKDDWDSDIPF